MTIGAVDYYTWRPYPADVPEERRMRCVQCGAPATVVRYRHHEIVGPCSAFSSLGNKTASLFTPYCEACAHAAGYGTYKDRGEKPPHLNGLERWLAHVLDMGDPEHLA